jgi:hypothetical protein
MRIKGEREIMEKLIEMLDSLMESGDFKTSVCEDDGCTYLGGEAAADIDYAASELLIESGGYPNYESMEQLKKLSDGRYFVTPGETDSFGWLTGCLHTPAGIIVYG